VYDVTAEDLAYALGNGYVEWSNGWSICITWVD
jgi:hypothetical protein